MRLNNVLNTLLNQRSGLIIKLACLALGILAFVLNYVEWLNFPNYVYSKIRISPQQLNNLFSLTVIVVLYLKFRRLIPSILLKISAALLIFSVVPIFVSAIARQSAEYLQSYLRRSWRLDQKQELVYGRRVYFFNFVKNFTAPDSFIIIAPDSPPWRYTGTAPFMAAWLYPRQVKAYTSKLKKEHVIPDYYLITSEADGAPQRTWPEFPIRAEKIIIYDWDSDSPVIYEQKNWSPSEWIGKSPWGLIIPKTI